MAGARADLKNYPFKAQIDALSQMGGKATLNGKTYDFTGLGNAEQNAVISDQMAQTMLDLQKNYGADYIQQRLADLRQSDPSGYAARQQLFDKILADSKANPDRPLADDTQKQIQSLLNQGSNLTTGPGGELEQVQQGVRGGQVARGNYLGNAAASQEASSVVQAGDQAQQQRQQEALSYLQSGVSPEDVQYRRIQQSLSNLGSAINGQTPQAEFSSLSGAQTGAAPFEAGNVVAPTVDTGAALRGQQEAADIYSSKVNWYSKQANPWTTGLSTAANIAGVASGLGWQPLSSSHGGSSGWSGTSFNGYDLSAYVK